LGIAGHGLDVDALMEKIEVAGRLRFEERTKPYMPEMVRLLTVGW